MRRYVYRAFLAVNVEVRAVVPQVVRVGGLFFGRQVRAYGQVGVCCEGSPRVAYFLGNLCVDIRVFSTFVLVTFVQLCVLFTRFHWEAVR